MTLTHSPNCFRSTISTFKQSNSSRIRPLVFRLHAATHPPPPWLCLQGSSTRITPSQWSASSSLSGSVDGGKMMIMNLYRAFNIENLMYSMLSASESRSHFRLMCWSSLRTIFISRLTFSSSGLVVGYSFQDLGIKIKLFLNKSVFVPSSYSAKGPTLLTCSWNFYDNK